jgi:hypothetical protein
MDKPGETETSSTADQLAAETNKKLAESVEKLVAIESQKMAEQQMEAARKREKETEAKDTSVNAIPEILLTPLLGFSGFRWDEWENLHPPSDCLHSYMQQKRTRNYTRSFGRSSTNSARPNAPSAGSQTLGCLTISSI